MHWETSRNQQRFAQIIEDVASDYRTRETNVEEMDKEYRQRVRRGLKRPRRPMPQLTRREKNQDWRRRLVAKFWPGSRTPLSRAVQPQLEGCRINHQPRLRTSPMKRLVREQELRMKLNIPSNLPQTDKNGRVDLERWIEKTQLQPGPWWRWRTDPPSVRFKLGQYLLDAARLFEAMTSYRDKKLLESFLMMDPPMHPRRTLDQAYYLSLNTTISRDRDQVVYRATTADPRKIHRWDPDRCFWIGHDDEEYLTSVMGRELVHETCPDCTANIRKTSRVIMVDQLWMWVLDEQSIITCFPKRYGKTEHETSDVHKSIRMRMAEGKYSIHSVFDLALAIFEECSGIFDQTRTRTCDKQPQVIDVFSEAIGNIVCFLPRSRRD